MSVVICPSCNMKIRDVEEIFENETTSTEVDVEDTCPHCAKPLIFERRVEYYAREKQT